MRGRRKADLRFEREETALVLEQDDGLGSDLGHDLPALLAVTGLLDVVTVENLWKLHEN